MNGLRHDLVFAQRQIRRQPGFALLVVLTLGSAIGVNASLFTAFNTFALRPWPVKDPERLLRVATTSTDKPHGMSMAEWRYVSEHTRSFSGLGLRLYQNHARLSDGRTVRTSGVSANYFDVLGVPMEIGRGFLPQEGTLDAPGDVAVLSYGAWQRLFGADRDIVGRAIELDGLSFTVIGVASRNLYGLTHEPRDIWLPPTAQARWSPDGPRPAPYLVDPMSADRDVMARLAPGVSAAAAQLELEKVSLEFRRGLDLPAGRFVLRSTTRGSTWEERRTMFAPFALLTLAVTFVLLLACANCGNLLLARASARRREIAVRLSLGASRARIVRQLLAESFVLAGLAGLLGVGIAAALPAAVVGSLAEGADWQFPLDARVLFYAVGLSTVACGAFGLAPALHGARTSVGAALKDAHGLPIAHFSLRSVLLGTQVALCVILLVGAGLMTRGLARAVNHDFGYDLQSLSVVTFEVPPRSKQKQRIAAFNTELVAQLPTLGPSTRVAATDSVPLDRTGMVFRLDGDTPDTRRSALVQFVTSASFDLLGIPVVAGRRFAPDERGLRPEDAAGTAIVSEAFARRFWPGETPLGRRMSCLGVSFEIVGIAGDVQMGGPQDSEAVMYLLQKASSGPVRVLVRDEGTGLAAAVVALAAHIDPQLYATVTPLSSRLDDQLRLTRLGTQVAVGISALALALATLGLAGVFAYSVQQRTRELGIRIALGARTRDVVSAVLSTATRALVVGLMAGTAGAAVGSILLRQVIYGLSPLDPVTYLSAAGLLLAAALAATFLPARRALRVDPTVALRYE
jgi:predicted permease